MISFTDACRFSAGSITYSPVSDEYRIRLPSMPWNMYRRSRRSSSSFSRFNSRNLSGNGAGVGRDEVIGAGGDEEGCLWVLSDSLRGAGARCSLVSGAKLVLGN